MSPHLPIHNAPDGALAHTIFERKSNLTFLRESCPDRKNVLVGQVAVGMCFATRMIQALLAFPIHRVVIGTADEEMRWVAAGRVIASVTNQHIVGDRTVNKLVHEAVHGECGLPEPDTAVTTCVASLRGGPAPIRASRCIYPGKKRGDLVRGKLGSHVSLLTDVPRRRVFQAPLRLSVLSEQLYQMGGGR